MAGNIHRDTFGPNDGLSATIEERNRQGMTLAREANDVARARGGSIVIGQIAKEMAANAVDLERANRVGAVVDLKSIRMLAVELNRAAGYTATGSTLISNSNTNSVAGRSNLIASSSTYLLSGQSNLRPSAHLQSSKIVPAGVLLAQQLAADANGIVQKDLQHG
jgi:hypothetical protein